MPSWWWSLGGIGFVDFPPHEARSFVMLLPAYCLVNAFEQIGGAEQGRPCTRKVHGHSAQGQRKAVHKRPDCLGLGHNPLVLKGLGTGAHFALQIGGIKLARIGKDGLCLGLFGLATWPA